MGAAGCPATRRFSLERCGARWNSTGAGPRSCRRAVYRHCAYLRAPPVDLYGPLTEAPKGHSPSERAANGTRGSHPWCGESNNPRVPAMPIMMLGDRETQVCCSKIGGPPACRNACVVLCATRLREARPPRSAGSGKVPATPWGGYRSRHAGLVAEGDREWSLWSPRRITADLVLSARIRRLDVQPDQRPAM